MSQTPFALSDLNALLDHLRAADVDAIHFCRIGERYSLTIHTLSIKQAADIAASLGMPELIHTDVTRNGERRRWSSSFMMDLLGTDVHVSSRHIVESAAQEAVS